MNKGYITLLATMLISTVCFGILVGFLVLGTGISKEQIFYEQGRRALIYAESCAEVALQRIADQQSFIGSDTVYFDHGQCSYIVDGDFFVKDIDIEGSAGDAVRRLQIDVSQDGVDWYEVQ